MKVCIVKIYNEWIICELVIEPITNSATCMPTINYYLDFALSPMFSCE